MFVFKVKRSTNLNICFYLYYDINFTTIYKDNYKNGYFLDKNGKKLGKPLKIEFNYKFRDIKRSKINKIEQDILKELVSKYPVNVQHLYVFDSLINQEVEIFYYKIRIDSKNGHIPLFLFER